MIEVFSDCCRVLLSPNGPKKIILFQVIVLGHLWAAKTSCKHNVTIDLSGYGQLVNQQLSVYTSRRHGATLAFKWSHVSGHLMRGKCLGLWLLNAPLCSPDSCWVSVCHLELHSQCAVGFSGASTLRTAVAKSNCITVVRLNRIGIAKQVTRHSTEKS